MKKKHSNAGGEGKTTFAKSSPYGTAESLTYVFPSPPESFVSEHLSLLIVGVPIQK
jgi:hypothetical protein